MHAAKSYEGCVYLLFYEYSSVKKKYQHSEKTGIEGITTISDVYNWIRKVLFDAYFWGRIWIVRIWGLQWGLTIVDDAAITSSGKYQSALLRKFPCRASRSGKSWKSTSPRGRRERKWKRISKDRLGKREQTDQNSLRGYRQRSVKRWNAGIVLWKWLFSETPFRVLHKKNIANTFEKINNSIHHFTLTNKIISNCKF